MNGSCLDEDVEDVEDLEDVEDVFLLSIRSCTLPVYLPYYHVF